MTKGTNDWKNVHKKLSEHENSSDHINSILIFITRSKITGRIDTELEKQIINEKKYWREVLKRVVATIKFISSYSLAFRGKNEVFFSENNGNYIGALEYLSEFDPFLREHEKYANCGTGTIKYLSSTICDEFISIISKDLQLTIVNEIKEAKFYYLIIDSTPDISHVDQLTVIIRYVLPSGIKKRFLGFLPIFSHTGEKLEKVILEFLNNIDLDITNCRGQSYDNAFNKSDFIQTVRDDFDNLEKEAEKVKDIAYTNDKKRQKIRKLFHDEIPEHEM
ncbi:zinc finger MYM-type protein 1-like [Centruroides vittatus]|uniref:zinc finger MYM-type protein 1-like n=1 Tax=Centruroides vittatus TaxID=120091 RepID=UPI00350E9B37